MTKSATLTLDLNSTIMLLMLAAVWGGSFFLGEIALREVPPLTITLNRVMWALPILALIVLFKGIYVPRSPKVWGAYLVMGALNNAIPFSLIFWGQTQIESGLASILNGTTAMFAAVVAGMLLRDEPLTTNKIIGAALGIAGVAVIIGLSALTDFNPSNLAQLAILGATLSYAFAGV
jgi:drug/metabolite transporter (DMT)-like permease